MMRSLLIYFSQARWTQKLVTEMPLARRVAKRFVAGETLDDAIAVVRDLNRAGLLVTLDQLGEHTTSLEEATGATEAVIRSLDAIATAAVRANVSLKLSQLGFVVNREACADNLRQILAHAQQRQNFIRIDMEESGMVEGTLELYRRMRQEGFENLGVVIQSYLQRSAHDVADLLAWGARIRLVKGAYLEPPEIAFPDKADVDENYDKLARLLMDAARQDLLLVQGKEGRFPPLAAIATHDEARIEAVQSLVRQWGMDAHRIEFQMLYGIRQDLQTRLVTEGFPVRVYVPYGGQWYPYFMRRLAERPANLWFFLSNLFR